jgi:hypothetical protein
MGGQKAGPVSLYAVSKDKAPTVYAVE